MFQFEPTTPRRGNSSHGGKQIPIPPPGCELVIPPSAAIAGGSYSKIYLDNVVNVVGDKKPSKIKEGYPIVVDCFVLTSICMNTIQ